MSSSGIHVGEGVRRGGLAPGSYEARAAIERVRLAMNPSQPRKYGHAPAWAIQTERKEPELPVMPQVEREPLLRRVHCQMCGIEVKGQPRKVRFCETCAPIREQQLWTERNAKHKVVRDAPCRHCGTVVRLEGNNKFCGDDCRKAVKKLGWQAYLAKRQAEEAA